MSSPPVENGQETTVEVAARSGATAKSRQKAARVMILGPGRVVVIGVPPVK
jgi:hypothetical protein